MALFRYLALQGSGKRFSGVITADSVDEAKELLRRQEIFVINLSLHKEKKAATLPPAILLSFTRDLAGLLKAGLPLYESLLTIEEKYRGMRHHALFLTLCDRVKHGTQLSKALTEFPSCFDPIYVSMVAAGEETGSLETVFAELGALLTRATKLKKQLISAMIYPAFLASFCFVVVAALFFFLIPSMKQLFEGRALHPLTSTVLAMSEWLNAHGATLGIALLTLITGAVAYLKHPRGKRAFSLFLLRAPLLRRVTTAAVMVRFCRALSVLLSSSIPMVEALGYARRIMHNPYFEAVIENAEAKIMQGGKLSDELASSPLMPKMVLRMLSIGEEAGNTPSMLKSIADIYEEDLDKGLARLTSMIQPMMLLLLAFIVGIVILSVLLPLTDVSSFIN